MRNLTCLIIAILFLIACAPQKGPTTTNTTSMGADELLKVAKESSERARKTDNREKQRTWAKHGISVAEQCLMRKPEEPGCYYYRAINTGLYHEVKIAGYQSGVKRMINDCQKVIQLDPKYDHGGAYRILGQLYTKLPQTTGRPDSVTRDLDKAEDYLEQALRIDPDYPENHLFIAETLVEKEEITKAKEALNNARELAPRWRHDFSYNTWKETIGDLEKKINKVTK